MSQNKDTYIYKTNHSIAKNSCKHMHHNDLVCFNDVCTYIATYV